MNILVAGGAGFIGSHLIDKLIGQGHSVICADKLIMGGQNIKHLRSSIKFYDIELADQSMVDKLFTTEKIHAVFHLAANSDIQKGSLAPSIDFNDTFLTTRTILESMRKNNIKNLFFASTSAVYGEMPDVELKEDTGGLKPVSFYGGAKFASEALISSYVSMCGLNAVIFRFPNVIGPRLTHGVVYDFIKKLKMDSTSLEILGDGTQCKPYIYIFDLVEAITMFIRKWPEGEQIYNLSVNGNGTTVTRIADIICQEMSLKDVAYMYTGSDRGWKGDVPKYQYDISKILSTGWIPKYTSDEAVRQSVRDVLKNL